MMFALVARCSDWPADVDSSRSRDDTRRDAAAWHSPNLGSFSSEETMRRSAAECIGRMRVPVSKDLE